MVQCNVCDEVHKSLFQHLKKKHNISIQEYNGDLYSVAYQEDSLEKIRQGRINDGKKTRAAKQANPNYVSCKVCNRSFKHLTNHLKRVHSLSAEEYLKIYPNGKLASKSFKEMALKRGRENGDWINRSKESGEDLTKYREKVGRSVSKSILNNPEERLRRSNLMKNMWKDSDKAKIFKKNQSETAKITSARPEIQKERSKRLKKWRDNNPEEFYEKCTRVMHKTWSSKPEKKLRAFAQSLNSNFKGNQQVNSANHFFVNKTARKQIDILDKDNKIIIELDGPHHFKPIFGDKNLRINQQKDAELDKFCQDKDFLLIRVSHTEYNYRISVDNFNQSALDKIQEILKENKPGIYKIGEEYESL
jgi:very-short-patch-repair endonuclease